MKDKNEDLDLHKYFSLTECFFFLSDKVSLIKKTNYVVYKKQMECVLGSIFVS